MFCVRCGKPKAYTLCDNCLKAAQAYIDAYDEASAAGVPMGSGDLGNRNRDAADVKEALERRAACS
jgi:hypothetical protein